MGQEVSTRQQKEETLTSQKTPRLVTINFQCEVMSVCESILGSPEPPLGGAAAFPFQPQYGSMEVVLHNLATPLPPMC